LLNECGFITGAKRSMNCSKIWYWIYYICFVVYSGSAQTLPHAP